MVLAERLLLSLSSSVIGRFRFVFCLVVRLVGLRSVYIEVKLSRSVKELHETAMGSPVSVVRCRGNCDATRGEKRVCNLPRNDTVLVTLR